ncbi:hypothetical protein KKD81_03440 [Patescibacteria group bacterium]|nr:hypothetical protein [Patescibacteria group bacterium]MBU2158858.1 hypothetical protein [Patescibacteria group bacterium]MBU2220959.1 hypothetical protein [Patescibacteria group bacterium]
MPRKATKQRVGQYALAALLSLVVIWLLFLVWGIARKEEIARKAVDDRKAELALLTERQAILQDNIDELSTERGHEATLRQTYGVARPGEEVIIVVPPKEVPVVEEVPWYTRALDWIVFWK